MRGAFTIKCDFWRRVVGAHWRMFLSFVFFVVPSITKKRKSRLFVKQKVLVWFSEKIGSVQKIPSKKDKKTWGMPQCSKADCEKEAAFQCEQCLSRFYCCEKCQAADWKSGHSKWCKINAKPDADWDQWISKTGFSQQVLVHYERLKVAFDFENNGEGGQLVNKGLMELARRSVVSNQQQQVSLQVGPRYKQPRTDESEYKNDDDNDGNNDDDDDDNDGTKTQPKRQTTEQDVEEARQSPPVYIVMLSNLLNDLPVETLVSIMGRLAWNDLLQLSQTSRRMREIISDPQVLRSMLRMMSWNARGMLASRIAREFIMMGVNPNAGAIMLLSDKAPRFQIAVFRALIDVRFSFIIRASNTLSIAHRTSITSWWKGAYMLSMLFDKWYALKVSVGVDYVHRYQFYVHRFNCLEVELVLKMRPTRDSGSVTPNELCIFFEWAEHYEFYTVEKIDFYRHVKLVADPQVRMLTYRTGLLERHVAAAFMALETGNKLDIDVARRLIADDIAMDRENAALDGSFTVPGDSLTIELYRVNKAYGTLPLSLCMHYIWMIYGDDGPGDIENSISLGGPELILDVMRLLVERGGATLYDTAHNESIAPIFPLVTIPLQTMRRAAMQGEFKKKTQDLIDYVLYLLRRDADRCSTLTQDIARCAPFDHPGDDFNPLHYLWFYRGIAFEDRKAWTLLFKENVVHYEEMLHAKCFGGRVGMMNLLALRVQMIIDEMHDLGYWGGIDAAKDEIAETMAFLNTEGVSMDRDFHVFTHSMDWMLGLTDPSIFSTFESTEIHDDGDGDGDDDDAYGDGDGDDDDVYGDGDVDDD